MNNACVYCTKYLPLSDVSGECAEHIDYGILYPYDICGEFESDDLSYLKDKDKK